MEDLKRKERTNKESKLKELIFLIISTKNTRLKLKLLY